MSLDEMIKYLIWIVFFGVALAAVIFMLKKSGVL